MISATRRANPGRSAAFAAARDGAGGADPARGLGLAGLADRVAAAGGTLTVHSRIGQGTCLTAELPADATLHQTLPQRPAVPDRATADDGPYAGRGGMP